MENAEITKNVRENYANVARQGNSCCGPGEATTSCGCGTGNSPAASLAVGYSREDIASAPDGANLGLGCGNPVALASLKEGETVLDLGSGAGFDCFLASKRVGPTGKVIGVDMTPEMLDRARENARKGEYKNIEFRLGEIENLPVADSFVDAIISNCVINLSVDKPRVFAEAFRVLKPEGRIMVSDIVLLQALPEFLKSSVEAYVGCVAGAMRIDEYVNTIRGAGFKDVKIVEETPFPVDSIISDPAAQAIIKEMNIPESTVKQIANSILSVRVQAVKKA
jgi:arsenite methyltransferase